MTLSLFSRGRFENLTPEAARDFNVRCMAVLSLGNPTQRYGYKGVFKCFKKN
jgi:hypothetical protein